jgi:hypothetical protein
MREVKRNPLNENSARRGSLSIARQEDALRLKYRMEAGQGLTRMKGKEVAIPNPPPRGTLGVRMIPTLSDKFLPLYSQSEVEETYYSGLTTISIPFSQMVHIRSDSGFGAR